MFESCCMSPVGEQIQEVIINFTWFKLNKEYFWHVLEMFNRRNKQRVAGHRYFEHQSLVSPVRSVNI